MIIDTHCHLIDEAFTQDVEACIVNAREADVQKIVLACCDEGEAAQILDLSKKHPGCCFATVGIHPENMEEDVMAQAASMKRWLDAQMMAGEKIVAIGEIGIDLHWDKTRLDDQRRLLAEELDWALEYNLPVLLHIRDAMQEFLDFLHIYINKENTWLAKGRKLRGVLHCYSGTAEEARQAMELADLYIGVGGTVTYKKSLVPEVVKAIGLDRIVLETDAPYLAPVPHRGKRNEPAYTADTARFLASLLDIEVEKVAATTTWNAEMLLGI